jgi:hypothetical protein
VHDPEQNLTFGFGRELIELGHGIHIMPTLRITIRLASNSTLRLRAASMAAFTSVGRTWGFISIRFTYAPNADQVSDSPFRGAFLVLPIHVAFQRQPALGSSDLDAIGRNQTDQFRALMTVRAISSSVRSLEVGKRTFRSFATAFTPATREAARSATILAQ